MTRAQPRPVSTAVAAVVLAATALVARSVMPAAASSAGASPAAAAPLPLPWGQAPGGPATPLAQLDAATAGAYDGAALVSFGCSGALVAPGDGPIPRAAPAYVLTNGHCIELMAPTEVRQHAQRPGTVHFGWPGSPVAREVAVRAVPWATMKGTDVAILELDATLAELVGAGITPVPIATRPPSPGTRVVVVGGPAPIRAGPRQLLLATCSLGDAHDLVEGPWAWFGFPANDCADIRPGSSGSPVLDAGTGEIVGLVSTGTGGSEGLADCSVNRPCEVSRSAVVSVPDASYGPLVVGLSGCFDGGWAFVGPGPGCPLDPGLGLDVRLDGATVQPADDGGRATWRAPVRRSDPSISHYAAKAGALGLVDCRDPAGYRPPVPLPDPPIVRVELPAAAGARRIQVCLLAGPGPRVDSRWQEPRFATVVTLEPAGPAPSSPATSSPAPPSQAPSSPSRPSPATT